MLSVGLTFDAAGPARAAAGLVGPNAAIQLAAALNAAEGEGAAGEPARNAGANGDRAPGAGADGDTARGAGVDGDTARGSRAEPNTARRVDMTGAAERVFTRARCLPLLRAPPAGMIDEAIPARLFEALWQEFPPEAAARIARDAGRRTGAYVLKNRIPAVARLLLRALPPRLAAPLLLKAIERNAWTFAGSGTCRTTSGDPAVVTIAANPLAMPGGAWHVGVFEALFGALVNPGTKVVYGTVRADGAPACRFAIDWRAGG
jgi:divinyl protochlorophyllide a 8-vinyl-reductase